MLSRYIPAGRPARRILTVMTLLGVALAFVPAYAQQAEPTSPTLPVPHISRPTPAPPEQILTGVPPGLPPGYMIVEGDILVTIAEFERRYRQAQGEAALPDGAYETNLWPDGVAPYEFDANVTAANRTAMETAMTDWETVSRVDFRQCAGNDCSGDYIHIQDAGFNSSMVGRQRGEQLITIVSWDVRSKRMTHELGHALGLEHEQSSPDRNTFVQINYGNICKATDTTCSGGLCFDNSGNRIDCDHNFNIASGARRYGVYDFDSLMHYSRDAFSRNGNDTITVLPPNNTQWQNAIGQRTHLSTRDQNVMGCMYPRLDWRWLSTTGSSSGSGACGSPYSTFATGISNTPNRGKLWIEPGSYAAVGTYSKPMELCAPNGTVILGN